MELFKLFGKIIIDNKSANQALDETSNKGQQTQSKLSKFFGGIGKGAAVVGKTVATGLAVGGAAMGALTVKAMNLGGELEQNMGGSEAVFKDYAGKMQETAKGAFSNMGLATSDYLATANKMGALFQGAGFSIKDSMDLSSGAMQRAADVASIMGIDTSAAMEAIAGAAKGNFTMMDNLGVAMNDTTLNAYALEKGIGKTTQEMTNQEKIGLAMEMFMEKTAYAAGNYAKENETLAGSLGTAKAALTNFLDGSGDVEQLVTSFSNLANVIVKNLKELAPRLVSGITEVINQVMPMLPPLLNQMLPVIIEGAVSLINGLVSAMPSIISALTNALPTLIQGVQQMMLALVDALPTLLPQIIEGTTALIVALASSLPELIPPIIAKLPEIVSSIATSLQENLTPLMDSVLNPIKEGLQGVFDWCKKNETPLTLLGVAIGTITAAIIAYNGAAIIKKALDIAETIQIYALIAAETAHSIASGIAAAATTAFGAAMAFLTSPITLIILAIGALVAVIVLCVKHWDKIKEVALKVWEGIKNVWNTVAEWFNTNVIQPLISFFKSLWDGIKAVWDGICNAVKFAINLIAAILDAAFQIITLPFRFIWENCKEYVFAAWEWIKNAVSTAINAVKNVITTVMNAIKSFFSTVWNGIKSVFTTVWNAIVNFLTPIINKIKAVITNAFNIVKNTTTTIFNAVKNVVMTVWNAIASVISTVVNKIKSVVTTVFNAVKSVVTTMFNAIKNTASNVWNGIKTAISNVVNGIKNTISNVFNSVKNTVGNIFNSIKEKMSAPIEKARDTIKGIVDKIKGFFTGLKIKFPDIKMPHFSVSPSGWKIGDLLKGSIPKLSIKWYAEAMRNPMIMNKPTVFGYDAGTGKLLGGGETGSEVVSGTSTLMRMIQAAVSSQNNALAYYLQKIVEILADYFPQVLDEMNKVPVWDTGVAAATLAPAMNVQLGIIRTKEERGR